MLYFKRLSLEDNEEIYDMLQEIDANENGFGNSVNGMTYSEFLNWIKQQYDYDRGINMPDWMVPQSSFWLYDGEKVIGSGRLRHCLNDFLEKESGHIGYAIRKTERGKGYGNKILELLIDKCREMKINPVQISANIDNEYSNKVILCNGGVLIRESDGKNFYHVVL